MNILLFGRGAITSLYGWALEQAGHTVTFYVRPGRATPASAVLPLTLCDARTRAQGLLVAQPWLTRQRDDLPADHAYELIIVSVPHYRLAEAAAFLGPRASQATILVFGNCWDDPLTTVAALPAAQLAWGFPKAGGRLTDAGLTGSLFAEVLFGSFNPALSGREVAVRELFRQSGFRPQEQADWRGWLWTHFAVNAGLFAQALRAGSPAQVLRAAGQRRQAIRQVRELLPVLARRGVALALRRSELQLYRLPVRLGSGLLWLLGRVSRPLRLLVESYQNGEEAERLGRDVLTEAHRLGLALPRLSAALASALPPAATPRQDARTAATSP